MFKVECVGCQAPYQVDERRVPANGLQMRCPKCGTSFRVEPKLAAEAAASNDVVPARGADATMIGSGPLSASPPAPVKLAAGSGRDALARTMIGVSVPTAGAAGSEENKALRGSAFRMPRPGDELRARSEGPAAAAAAKPEPSDFTKPTVREMSAATATPEPDWLDSFDASASLGKSDEPATAPRMAKPELVRTSQLELGRVQKSASPQPPAMPSVGPAARIATARPQTASTQLGAVASSEIADLPLALKPALRKGEIADLPSTATPHAFKAVPGLELTDLPQAVPGGAPKLPPRRPKKGEPGLPETEKALPAAAAPRRPPPRRREAPPRPATAPAPVVDLPARLEDIDAELPLVSGAGRAPQAAGLPSLARKPAAAPEWRDDDGLDELDLPQVAPAMRKPADNDLPSVLGDPDLPRVFAPSALSAPPGLPALFAPSALSAPPGLPAVVAPGLRPRKDDDLPSVLGDASLPSAPGDYLPAVIGHDLPAPSEPGLPARRSGFGDVDLPALNDSGLPAVLGDSSFGELDLPLVGRGTGPAELPSVGQALPAVREADLPLVGQALPALRQPDLPEVGQAWPALRQAELPAVGQVLPALKGAELPAVGQVLPELRQPDLPSIGQVLPELRQPDLPEVGQVLPATKRAFNAGESQEDLEAALDSLSFPPPEEPPFPSGEDPFGPGDMELDTGRALHVDAPASGLGYGELEFGGAGSAPIATADDMEFSAIPEDGAPPAPRAAASAAVHDAEAEPASTLEMSPSRARPARRSRRALAVAGVVSLIAIAGAALALKPALGPFGAHWIADRINLGQNQALLSSTIAGAQKELTSDTLAGTRAAIALVDAAAQQAPRFEPLKAYGSYVRYWAVLRFGPLPELEAAAKALSDAVDPGLAAPEHALNMATKSAVAAPAAAKAEINALGAAVEARTLLGEVELASGNVAPARAIWQALVDGKKAGAQALFGLARVELAEEKWQAAAERAREVLALSPAHVGAKILALEAARGSEATQGQAGGETQRWADEVNAALPKGAPAEAALAHTVLGELHLSHGRIAPAQKSFEDALQIVRQLPRALIGLGEVLSRSGRNAEALARFQSAVEADKTSLAARLGVAKSELELQHVPESKALLAKLQEQYPKHWDVVYWVGRANEADNAQQAALAAYQSAIELGAGRPEALKCYLALAHLQGELGELSAAAQTLSEAEAKLPPSAPLLKAFGEIALSQGHFSDALKRFEGALELDAEDTRSRFLAAVSLTRLGRFEEALTAFLKVSESDKNFPGLALERGRLFEESGKVDEALKEYEAALAHAPGDLELELRVGCSRVVAGRAKEAKDLLEHVQKAQPRTAEVYHCMGRAAMAQGDLPDAVRLLERAVALDANQAQYHLYVGWVSNDVGRSSAADAALERALELDKGLADAYWQRGVLRRKQGATRDAVKDLKHALELKPSRYEAYADLALSYTDLGQTELATNAWERALAARPDNALWQFRYGKLLSAGAEPRSAAAPLTKAIQLAAKPAASSSNASGDSPAWLSQAHYLLARTLGGADAIPHWQSYLRLSPPDDPYRSEAQDRLRTLGQPWEGR